MQIYVVTFKGIPIGAAVDFKDADKIRRRFAKDQGLRDEKDIFVYSSIKVIQ